MGMIVEANFGKPLDRQPDDLRFRNGTIQAMFHLGKKETVKLVSCVKKYGKDAGAKIFMKKYCRFPSYLIEDSRNDFLFFLNSPLAKEDQ